jgi:hemoglobin
VATIFERYGGFASVRKVVSAFYDDVMDTPSLAHHFAGIDMRRLIEHQTLFIAYLMDGPGAGYGDEVLERVHRRLGINADEFDEMAHLLVETLEDQGFVDEDVAVIDERFRKRESIIVTAPVQQGSA